MLHRTSCDVITRYENGSNGEMSSAMTTQNRLKFCEQTVLIDMQLATQKLGTSRKHFWSQAPSKDFLMRGPEHAKIISLLKFDSILTNGCWKNFFKWGLRPTMVT